MAETHMFLVASMGTWDSLILNSSLLPRQSNGNGSWTAADIFYGIQSWTPDDLLVYSSFVR
jgi:hypothetical protein